MTRRILIAALVTLATACSITKTDREGPRAGCSPAENTSGLPSACASNADCCSYNCAGGVCLQNTAEGGTCRTTADCYGVMLCKSGHCTSLASPACRDNEDICTSDLQCCSANCAAGGVCKVNHPPVAAFTVVGADTNGNVPYHVPVTLQNASTDPDGDALLYTWSFVYVPTGSAATLSSLTATSPTFTPDLEGAYEVKLVVTDRAGGNGLTSEVSHIIHAVNVPPTVDAGTYPDASRNVSMTLSGTATDADQDPLTCTWRATPPGGGQDVLLGSGSCSGTFTASFTPTAEGPWTVTLTANDGTNARGSTATVNCVNDAPVAKAGPDQVWNLGATPAQNPVVPLAGSYTDRNGDDPTNTPTWSWLWTIQAPPGSAVTNERISTPTAQNASFVPDVEGTYVVQLQVCDRPPNYCGTATAKIDVYRYIQEFTDRRVVNAADYAHGVNKIAMAGPDPADGMKGKVWLLDAATGTEVSASLDGVPDTIAVTPDGSWAVAGSSLWLWVVKLSVSPATVTRVSGIGAIGSIALVAQQSEALVFPSASGSYFYHFNFASATPATTLTSSGFIGNAGRVDKEGANLYVLNSSWPELARYLIGNKGGFSLTYYTWATLPYSSGISDLWMSQDSAHLFTSTGEIRSASTLAVASSFVYWPQAIDSLPDGQAALLLSDRLALYSTSLAHTTDDSFPRWGIGGAGYSVVGDGGFIRLDPADPTNTKTIRYALIHTTGATPGRSGLVTYR